VTQKKVSHAGKLTLLAACSMLAACGGGGGGGGGTSEGRLQVINFNYPGGNTLLNGPTTLVATATSGLPVSFRSGTTATCTVAENKLTLLAAGECLVIASQAGGDAGGVKWAAADETSQLFNVLKHGQEVTFTPPDYVLSSATTSVPLSATASSGLPVTFSSTTPTICTISGNNLQLLAKGSCAVSATQAGNADYAEQTTQRFIAVDPLVVADGFAPGSGRGTSNSMSTKQGGGVTVNPWASPLNAGWEWCDANSGGDWCYRTVSDDGSTLTSALRIPDTMYTGGWQYSFNRIDIFAPGLTGFNSSGDTTGGLQVTTEQALGFTLGMNRGLWSASKPVVVHLDLGKRNGTCNVTLSTLVYAPQPGSISYAVPLTNFAVTETCGLADVTGASLDNDVRTLPNPYDAKGQPTNAAAFAAALEKIAASRTSAAALLKSSNVVRTRFWLMDANTTIKPEPTDTPTPTPAELKSYISDLTIKGAITIQ